MESDEPAPLAPTSRSKGFLAACAGIYLVGLGHVIAGRVRRGLFWFTIAFGLSTLSFVCAMYRPLMPALPVIIPLMFGAWIVSFIDAYRIGRQSPRGLLGNPQLRAFVAVRLIVASLFISPA